MTASGSTAGEEGEGAEEGDGAKEGEGEDVTGYDGGGGDGASSDGAAADGAGAAGAAGHTFRSVRACAHCVQWILSISRFCS